MKHLTSIAILAPLIGSAVFAQIPLPAESATPPVTTARALFTAEQLDQLLGPIALYPDALIALILPASTNPSDVVLAARFLNGGGDQSQIDTQPWDDSV